jgi:hypothetical protein
MSPARTSDDGIDFNKLVHRILLDITLLKWFATTGGRSIAVINALIAQRREGNAHEARILDFLERHVTGDRGDG